MKKEKMVKKSNKNKGKVKNKVKEKTNITNTLKASNEVQSPPAAPATQQTRSTYPPTIQVGITYKDWQRLSMYIETSSDEISIFGLTRLERIKDKYMVNHRIIIDRLLPLPRQVNTGTSTEVEADDLERIAESLLPEERKRLNLWVHSHVNMQAFWSGTDEQNIDEWTRTQYLLSIVMNKQGDFKIRYDMLTPIKHSCDKVNLVLTDLNDISVAAYQKSYKEIDDAITALLRNKDVVLHRGIDVLCSTKEETDALRAEVKAEVEKMCVRKVYTPPAHPHQADWHQHKGYRSPYSGYGHYQDDYDDDPSWWQQRESHKLLQDRSAQQIQQASSTSSTPTPLNDDTPDPDVWSPEEFIKNKADWESSVSLRERFPYGYTPKSKEDQTPANPFPTLPEVLTFAKVQADFPLDVIVNHGDYFMLIDEAHPLHHNYTVYKGDTQTENLYNQDLADFLRSLARNLNITAQNALRMDFQEEVQSYLDFIFTQADQDNLVRHLSRMEYIILSMLLTEDANTHIKLNFPQAYSELEDVHEKYVSAVIKDGDYVPQLWGPSNYHLGIDNIL